MGHRRIYIIAGEPSGDLHGSNLVREVLRADPTVEIRAWGGDRMAAEGAVVVKHYRDLAFMGFTQVLFNLRTIMRNLAFCKADIAAFEPDLVVLIDYPGFNLRIAEHLQGSGIPVDYYISPQLWAWKPGRVKVIQRTVRNMFVILPFEKQWYADHGVDAHFVGHPLLDAIARSGNDRLPDDGRPVVALLPGSRMQEIERMLPAMLRVVGGLPDHRFIVAASASIPPEVYARYIGDMPVEVVHDRTYALLRSARAALVTSGTATLETALFNVPQVVCYKGSAVNVWLAKRLINIQHISLVNIIVGRAVVRELVQRDLATKPLSTELKALLLDGDRRKAVLDGYAELHALLGGPGASARVAAALWKSPSEAGANAAQPR